MIIKVFRKIKKLVFQANVKFLIPRGTYGQLPIKLLNYEKLYDKKTGGRYDIYLITITRSIGDAKNFDFGSTSLKITFR